MLMRSIAILLLSILPCSLSFGQGDAVPQEYLVKAKYLLNIPLFIEMPSQENKESPFTICLNGDSPLESILGAAQGQLIKNRPLTVRKVDDLDQEESCQVLFIASSERHRLRTLLPAAHRQGILTISDMRDFTRMGGMIGLVTVDNRVTFDLNLSAASKSSISFSSHLLKLARDISN